MGKLTPLDLASAKKGYAKFLKINKLKEGATPKDAELAEKKANWETKIESLSKSEKPKATKASKKEAGTTRESKKYDYPKGCDSKEDRKKYRSKMRAEANGGSKPKAAKTAKAKKEAPVKKVAKKKSKKTAEAAVVED